MKTLYFDLETTSKYVNTAEILEFAYIIVDPEVSIEPIEMGDMYFYPDRPIPASATAVNGLNMIKMELLSKGVKFYQKAKDIRDLMSRTDINIAGYNSRSYDLPILQNHLDQSGVERIKLSGQHIDFCRIVPKFNLGTPNHKLGTLFKFVCDKLNASTKDMDEMFISWCSQCGIANPSTKAHGALYDSFMTYMVYLYLNGNGFTC